MTESCSNNILDFEQFKGEKELEEFYPVFLGNVERTFNGRTSPKALFQRLYYTLRYLEGNLRTFQIFPVIGITTDIENDRGKKFLIEWLESMLNDLKGI